MATISRGSLRNPLPDPQAELAEARREVANAEARLAGHEGRPGGPHPNTRQWLARARRRLEAAEARVSGRQADPGAWQRKELETLTQAYSRALVAGSWSATMAPAHLAGELEVQLPGRSRLAIEHQLGYISAIVEEEGLKPLQGIPPRPGYADDLRRIVAAEIHRPRAATRSKYGRLTAWLAERPDDEFDVSFKEIEQVLGFSLPPSSRRHAVHWHSAQGSAVVRAIQAAGWRARRVDLKAERLTFQREP